MQKSDEIIKREKYPIRFKNQDMDFIFSWMLGVTQVIGMSHGQLFYAVHDIGDGDPDGWREGFSREGRFLVEEASRSEQNHRNLAAGEAYFGAAYAFRAALQFTDPNLHDFDELVKGMEDAFQQGVRLMSIPMRSIDVPFENAKLPGYYLEHDAEQHPTLLMVGGGDTFREDLFYFAGYPGWKRGYNVLMVDLPGQGKLPGLGQHIRADMDRPIIVCLDWLEANAVTESKDIAIYGVSGGGYFTAQAVANERRIKAWVASTPITDMAEVFRKEVGSAVRAPGFMLSAVMRLSGSFNKSAEINLKKYAWQFGTKDFKTAAEAVLQQAKPVDSTSITCPSLFLSGENEADELKRQAKALYEVLKNRGVDVSMHEFTAAEGGDAHCQLNNLRLCHEIVFDWLDRVFEHDPGDVRLRC